VPAVEAGTVNVTPEGMAPELEVVIVAGLVVNVVPSYFTVIFELAAKLDPDTVIVDPTAPVDELMEIVGLSVKVVDAVFWVGIAESENVMVLMPPVCEGTVKVALTNWPVELVPLTPLIVTGAPPNVAVKAELAAKAEPEMVTVEPATPAALTGLVIVIEGTTVKVALP
jgi:hypothetical protein